MEDDDAKGQTRFSGLISTDMIQRSLTTKSAVSPLKSLNSLKKGNHLTGPAEVSQNDEEEYWSERHEGESDEESKQDTETRYSIDIQNAQNKM